METITTLRILSVCLIIHLSAANTPYKTCGNPSAKVLDVTVVGCNSPPCALKKGTNASFSLTFEAGKAYTAANADVHGIIGGIPLPFQIPNPDGCHNCNLVCPLESGKTYVYKNTIPVSTSYPKLQLIVKWELLDQNGDDIVCIELPAQIVD